MLLRQTGPEKAPSTPIAWRAWFPYPYVSSAPPAAVALNVGFASDILFS